MNLITPKLAAEHQKNASPDASAPAKPNGVLVRHEFKYFVPQDRCDDLKKDLGHFLAHDEHTSAATDNRYTVRSLYFDTPNIRFYFEKLHGNNCRSKIRIRRYENLGMEPSDWFFEVKSKYHNACVKPPRLGFTDTNLRQHLQVNGSIHLKELVAQISPQRAVSQQATIWGLPLEPKILVIYDREAFVDAHRRGFRVTFDSNIRAVFSGNPYEQIGRTGSMRLPILMEVKFEKNTPLWLDALIRKYNLRTEPTSKYNQGVEASFPLIGVPRARAFSDEGVSLSALAYLKHLLGIAANGNLSGSDFFSTYNDEGLKKNNE